MGGGSESIAPRLLDLGTIMGDWSVSHVESSFLGQEPHTRITKETGWAPTAGEDAAGKKEISYPARKSNPSSEVVQSLSLAL